MLKEIFLFLFVFLVGCSLFSSSSSIDFNPYQGSYGLTVDFYTEPSSQYIQEDSEFPLTLTIHNRGSQDVKDAKIVISTERDLVDNSDPVLTETLLGKKRYLENGESKRETIYLKSKKIFLSKEQESDIVVSYCYKYKTFLTESICIRSDPHHNYDDVPNNCPRDNNEPQIEHYSGQGAPVVITSLTSRMIPSKKGVTPQITLEVRNYGGGKVIKKELYEDACSSKGIGADNYGVIDVGNIYLGKDKLKCSVKELVVKDDPNGNKYDETTITCKGNEILSDQPYVTSLSVTLSYGYKESFSDYITINKQK